jgi:putative polyhydroxyalkanoate system protein
VPDIKMIKYHHLSVADAKQLVQQVADDLGEEYDLQSRWHGDTLRFHRAGVEGEMRVNASEIELEVTLGFLLKPLKARFVQAIEHRFDRIAASVRTKAAKAADKAPAKKPATRAPAKKAARK